VEGKEEEGRDTGPGEGENPPRPKNGRGIHQAPNSISRNNGKDRGGEEEQKGLSKGFLSCGTRGLCEKRRKGGEGLGPRTSPKN